MILSLLAIVSEGDRQAPAGVYNELNLNNGGWVLIAIMAAIILALLATTIYFAYKYNVTKQSQDDTPPIVSPEENDLLNKYRKLNEEERNLIGSTIDTLSKK